MNLKFSPAQRSWICVDAGNSAFATSILTAVFPIYLVALAPPEGIQIDLGFFSFATTGLGLWGYTVSLSAIVILLMSVFLSAWADEHGKRKLVFASFTLVGVIGTFLLALLTDWRALYICFLLANVGFAGSFVFYNSLLNFVAKEDERDRISLHGFAWGYVAGGLMLLLNLVMIMKYEWFGFSSNTVGTRWSFALCALWWLMMSLPALFGIQEHKLKGHGHLKQLQILWQTLKALPKQWVVLIFIVSYFFCNEGIMTVVSMSGPYGKEVLKLNQEHLIGTFLVIQFVGWPATLGMIFLTKKWGALKVYSASILMWVGIIVYAFFMTSMVDFFVLGLLVALVLGVSQALPRAIYSRLIPKGKEAEYFTLYALSGRSTPILGPLIFSAVSDSVGDPRIAIVSLASLFGLGFIGLRLISSERLTAAQNNK